MISKTYTISPYYKDAIIRGANRLNHNTAELLQAAGLQDSGLKSTGLKSTDLKSSELNSASNERLSPEKVTSLIRSVWQAMDDEFMGFTQQRCKQGVFAIMARQSIHCQTLREVLIQGTQFYNLIRNDIGLRFEELGSEESGDEEQGEARLSFYLKDETLDPDHFIVEFFLLIWHRFSIWLVGQKVPLKYANFSYPSPGHVKEYSLLFPCHCRFDQTENSIVFDRSAL